MQAQGSKVRVGWVVAVSALAVGAACSAAAAQSPQIINLGVLPATATSRATAISADGSTVVGLSGGTMFRWTAAGGMQAVDLPGMTGVVPTGVSNGGQVICGYGTVSGLQRAFRWREAYGSHDLLSTAFGGQAQAFGISANGQRILGWSQYQYLGNFFRQAVAWGPDGNGLTFGVEQLAGSGFPAATAASADGSIIVGQTWESHPFRWTAATHTSALPADSMRPVGVSSDGMRIVGTWGTRAAVWNYGEGISYLPLPPGASTSTAMAASADGLTVVGWSPIGAARRAFLWTTELGAVDLLGHLTDLGVDMAGWSLREATGISADGLTITGEGLYQNQQRGWVVTIPAPGTALTLAGLGLWAVRRRRGAPCACPQEQATHP